MKHLRLLVVDASGQVVPGADVIITIENTGEARRGQSNEIPALRHGHGGPQRAPNADGA